MCRTIPSVLCGRFSKGYGRHATWAEYWYNTSFQTSAGMSPFQALYGREPPTLARYTQHSSSHKLVEAYFLHRDEVLEKLKGNLLQAQHRMKKFADARGLRSHCKSGASQGLGLC